MSKPFLTPETMRQMVSTQLVVRTFRTLTESGTVTKRPIVTTDTAVYSFEQDIDGNLFFSELLYSDETETDGSYSDYHNLIWPVFEVIPPDEIMRHYHRVLSYWTERDRRCLRPEQVVISGINTLRPPHRYLINPHNIEMLEHYAKLQTCMAYEMLTERVTMKPQLQTVFSRFASFLRDLNRPWIVAAGISE